MQTILSYSNTTHAVDRPSLVGRSHTLCGMNLEGQSVELDEQSVDCVFCRGGIDHGDAIREYISRCKREAAEMGGIGGGAHLSKSLQIRSVCKALGITEQQLRYAVPGCADLNWSPVVNPVGISRMETAVVNRA